MPEQYVKSHLNPHTGKIEYRSIGTPVKAADGDTVSGYLVRFTDPDNPDLHGEYFDSDTYFWEKERPIKGIPILIDHTSDDTFKGLPVGIVTFAEEKEVGIWIEGKLHEREQYLEYLQSMRVKGIIEADDEMLLKVATNIAKASRLFFGSGHAQWSSGAHPPSVDTAENGHIKSWAIIEATGVMSPAEPDGTEIQLKSAFEQLDDIFTQIQTAQVAKDATEHKEPHADVEQSHGLLSTKTDTLTENPIMDEQMLRDMIREILAEMLPGDGDDAKMDEDEIAEAVAMDMEDDAEKADDVSEEDEAEKMANLIVKHINAKQQQRNNALDTARKVARKAALNAPVASSAYLPAATSSSATPHIEVRSKFAHWSAEDFSFASSVVTMLGRKGLRVDWQPDQKFYREFADKATEKYNRGDLVLPQGAVKSLHAMKADELDYSTQAGYGDEWVPTVWADNIWDKPRNDNVIQNIFESIEMPSNPYEYPVESTDPTVYHVAETTGEAALTLASSASPIPDSKIGTGKMTFTAKKLALRVLMSGELEEDGIARLMPKFREQAERAMQNAIDHVAINGDTSTSGNINLDTGTPGSTARYMAYDGLLHQAIVTASSNAINTSGASPTLAHIRQARFALGNAVATNPADLAIICDVSTYGKLLAIDEVQTIDKYGANATVVTGELGRIDGMPIFISGEMALADVDGKITDGGNVSNRGRLIVVHRPSWKTAYRRRVAQHMEYLAGYDTWMLTMTLRNDFKGRTMSNGTQQSTDDTVAVLYNIAV